MVEIALQGESKGILYEGYTKAFKQCIFEEGDVAGRNERYEFRCDYDLECCGRVCCVPTEATIPLWLIIIFIILFLILLLAALATLAYIWAKRRKPKPKKDYLEDSLDGRATKGGYQALETANNRNGTLSDPYGTNDYAYSQTGSRQYGGPYDTGRGRGAWNGDYDYNSRGFGIDGPSAREIAIQKRGDYHQGPRRDSRVTMSSEGNGSVVRHGVHEKIEESFKQEITYERPASTDSREML